jgi:hypothetical protein
MTDREEEAIAVYRTAAPDLAQQLITLEEQAAPLKERIAALKETVDALEARAASIKESILAAMTVAGIRSASLPYATLSVVDGADRVTCENLDAVPAEYTRVKTEADIAGAKACLKTTGTLPPGFAVERGAPYLRVLLKKGYKNNRKEG